MDLAHFGTSVPVTCPMTTPIALDDLLTAFAQQTDKLAKVIGTENADPNLPA